MGVKGLNNFITRFEKTIIDRIDMREEIENWKIDHNGKPPTILIDLKEISHVLVQHDEIGLILGGKYDHYNKMMKIFLENLQRTKAELVFFHAGKKYTDDIEFFIPKQEDDYMNCIEILNKIEEQSDLRAYLVEKNKLSQDIRMTLSFQYNLLKLVRRFGTVQINYVRHNQEIAKYANEHSDDVLAVISNDTDFMAFDGDFQYWPANTINIRQLSGKRYCKYKLRDKLGLNPWQIQLLSALSGSNFLPYYIIKEWTIQLTTENGLEKRGRIWNVSHYVKNQTYEIVNNEAQFDLNKISGDVFGPDYTPAQLNSIANGLACYDLNIKSEIDERDAFVKFTKNHNWFIYKMITDDIFKIRCIEYIDFRNYKSKNYAELVLPILKKLFGILYKDNRHRPGSHQICMKHAHDEPYKLTEVNIVYPPMKLPPLFDLIFKNKERQFDQFRWSLCEWILDLDKGFMKNLSDKKKSKFFACILTLKYLVQQDEFTAKEANAIIYTENKIRSLGSSQIDYPNMPNVHFVRIAHLYVKIYVLICRTLDVCGLHEMTDLIRFDGAYFHKNMEKFEISNQQQMRVLLSTIEPIWVF